MKRLLPEVCKIQYGYAFDSAKFNTNAGVPVIRIRDVVRGFSETYTTEECAEEYIVQDDDILIGMDGEFNIARWKGGKAYLNQRVCRLFPSAEVDSTYLYYFMPKALKSIEEKTPFVTVKHLSAKEINKIVVPIWPIEEQKIIATELQKVDELIELRKQQLSKFDELVKFLFIELFDKAENSKISKLNDVCEEITAGGDRPKDTSEIKTKEYPYPVFANAATNEGLLCFSREYKIEKPCVTIAARGCTVGFTAIRREKFTPVVRLISLVPNETVTPIYLKHYIDIKMNIEGNGAAQPQLTIPMIKSMEIMVPPIELQNQFAAFVEQTDKSKLEVQKGLEKLEILKKSLMQQYFG